jgi:hypothetical protein
LTAGVFFILEITSLAVIAALVLISGVKKVKITVFRGPIRACASLTNDLVMLKKTR